MGADWYRHKEVLIEEHNKPRRDNHYQPFSFDDFP